MIVTLITQAKYDLLKKEDFERLRKYISVLSSRKKMAELRNIQQQVANSLDNNRAKIIYQKSCDCIARLDKSNQFLNENAVTETNSNQINNMSLDDKLKAYITKPVTKKKKNGESNFQEVYGNLLIDLSTYTGNMSYACTYAALVTNMFMHNATYSPVNGHGKSQIREYSTKSQLQYFRSQGEHPTVRFHINLTSDEPSTGKCRMPLNPAFLKLWKNSDISEKINTDFKKFNALGYPKTGTTVDGHFITKIAHSGARLNNFSVISNDMAHIISENNGEPAAVKLSKKLTTVLHLSKKIQRLEKADVISRTNALLQRFKETNNKSSQSLNLEKRLYSSINRWRSDRVNQIKTKLEQLKLQNIKIEDNSGSSCLIIKLYPRFINDTDDYKEGVTNVLLSIFGGLLNHFCEQRGYSLHTERRQSFGFIRPTLTDGGSLRLRLSLGLEPHQFDDIVLECLNEFNELLSIYKFDDRFDKSVAALFTNPPHLTRDSYLRNIVRKDDRTLRTFRQAKAYFDQGRQKSQTNYLKQSMNDFLQEYVINQKNIEPEITINSENKVNVEVCSSKIFDLLNRVVDYANHYVSEIKFLENNEPLNEFAHSFWHLILKLFNNCNKAKYLIENLERLEATHFYAKASLLIENILEYLVLVDGLLLVRNQNNNLTQPIDKLKNSEITDAIHQLDLKREQVDVFFTDSGQQAITTSLLVMSGLLHGELADGKKTDHDVFLFDESYFEVKSFMEDVDSSLICKTKSLAKILFIDFTQLNKLVFDEFKSLKSIVIDLTHFPSLDDDLLKKIITEAHKRDVWVALVESDLKHKQLGLDKYQTGKIMTLAPQNKGLSSAARDEFQSISDCAMHSVTASYLNMVNEICQEKERIQKVQTSDVVSINALSKVGVFASRQPIIQPNISSSEDMQKISIAQRNCTMSNSNQLS